MATKSKSAKPQTARAQIRAHTKKVREQNAKAHEDRLTGCTKAAESVVLTADGQVIDTAKVTRVPIGASGVDAKGKARVPRSHHRPQPYSPPAQSKSTATCFDWERWPIRHLFDELPPRPW